MIEETTVNGGYGGFTLQPMTAPLPHLVHPLQVQHQQFSSDGIYNTVVTSALMMSAFRAGDDGFMFPAVPFLEALNDKRASGYGLYCSDCDDHRHL